MIDFNMPPGVSARDIPGQDEAHGDKVLDDSGLTDSCARSIRARGSYDNRSINEEGDGL